MFCFAHEFIIDFGRIGGGGGGVISFFILSKIVALPYILLHSNKTIAEKSLTCERLIILLLLLFCSGYVSVVGCMKHCHIQESNVH